VLSSGSVGIKENLLISSLGTGKREGERGSAWEDQVGIGALAKGKGKGDGGGGGGKCGVTGATRLKGRNHPLVYFRFPQLREKGKKEGRHVYA